MQPQAFSLEACGRARLQPCRNLRPFFSFRTALAMRNLPLP
jgi:hypothetical protein